MADPELEAIRARRMAELQQQMGGGSSTDEQQQKQEESRARQEEMKNSILVQVLDQAARARLNSIALVKPEKAKMVENMLCQMATQGQLPGKIGEEQLKSLLEQVSMQTAKKTTVKFDRRRMNLDDSDDDY
ncbi:programmed cell death protein 5-like [Amphiura filiformis]|uniref:programmed cell death protein 5-like n=1 Tax=Amphiura filiformis TaxID=82378 RepID=UPI003B21646E